MWTRSFSNPSQDSPCVQDWFVSSSEWNWGPNWSTGTGTKMWVDINVASQEQFKAFVTIKTPRIVTKSKTKESWFTCRTKPKNISVLLKVTNVLHFHKVALAVTLWYNLPENKTTAVFNYLFVPHEARPLCPHTHHDASVSSVCPWCSRMNWPG